MDRALVGFCVELSVLGEAPFLEFRVGVAVFSVFVGAVDGIEEGALGVGCEWG